jgi:hypothetical protein
MTDHFLPDSKVTIIVEGMERVTKISVPLASKPNFGVSHTYNLHTGDRAEMLLAFNTYAIFDLDKNNTHIVTEQSLLEAENDILDQAKEILQRRWDHQHLKEQLNGSVNSANNS